MANPTTWKMVKEAVEQLGGKGTNGEIKRYINQKYGAVNDNTINCTILLCCVNKQSRVNWPENSRPRLAESQYDFLYSSGRGQVELYNPEIHGNWEIRQEEDGKLVVEQLVIEHVPGDGLHLVPDIISTLGNTGMSQSVDMLFPLEAHLRDFIAKNLSTVNVSGSNLRLYVDDQGNDGIEYQTGVGRIDILAVDEQNGDFVVLELKLSRGVDSAMGQLLRYMGWVKVNLSPKRTVRGIIVAGTIDDKLKYAASIVDNVSLFKYQIDFSLEEEALNPVLLNNNSINRGGI
ncbi:endonuclease NucS domain-containing protein [Paenibacillus sp. NPDC057934]|uniref:endonuclease NucS domain-containing protein n=1 Tax=Paenibacillus sp. NPDC057934 TaxID=3346282 RepID=UPI0036D948EE